MDVAVHLHVCLFHSSEGDSDSDVDLDSLCNSPGTRDSGINEDCILLGIGPWEGLLDVVKVREGEGEGGGRREGEGGGRGRRGKGKEGEGEGGGR